MILPLQRLAVSFGCAAVIVGPPVLALAVAGFDPMFGFVLLWWLGTGLVIHHWIWGDE